MSNNKFSQLAGPPPPIFTGKRERDFVKQVATEVMERLLSMEIAYYAISLQETEFHPLYGEAIKKTFLPPIRPAYSAAAATLITWRPAYVPHALHTVCASLGLRHCGHTPSVAFGAAKCDARCPRRDLERLRFGRGAMISSFTYLLA